MTFLCIQLHSSSVGIKPNSISHKSQFWRSVPAGVTHNDLGPLSYHKTTAHGENNNPRRPEGPTSAPWAHQHRKCSLLRWLTSRRCRRLFQTSPCPLRPAQSRMPNWAGPPRSLYSVHTLNRIKTTKQAVGVQKCSMARAATAPSCPRTPRRRPATSKAAKRTNVPCPDRDLDPPLELYCW